VRPNESELYAALIELAQSISGQVDLDSLCSGLAKSLQRIVDFDYLALVLHDAARRQMWLRSVNGKQQMAVTEPWVLPAEPGNPVGWVWFNQQPLIIPSTEQETQWPEFIQRIRHEGIRTIVMLPLTSCDHRRGILGFGWQSLRELPPAELRFLNRVASEFAVAVDTHLTRQELVRERERLRVLFEITDTLVSKLSWDELLGAVSTVLAKVLPHEGAAITVLDKVTGKLHLHALHIANNVWLEIDRTPLPAADLPAGRALGTGQPVITEGPRFEGFPPQIAKRMRERGVRAICTIPLFTSNGAVGTLQIGRTGPERFREDEVEFAVQVARQIAIALENSLAFRELTEIKEKLATEKLYLEDEIRTDQNLGNMVGQSPAFQALLKSIQIVAPTDATVLIQGETGTGKELVARAIHEASNRKDRSFVKVNCAAIPSTLLESELFGHERGAFTGALTQKIGRIELAHQGTLFLDEVGEIPLELQAKLLRVIQEQEFERLGSNRTIRVDVRLIAATNRDLKAMVEENKFRGDLYYRLHVFPIDVPALRDRKEDIPLLMRYFTQKYARRMGRQIDSIPAAAIEVLTRYDWPGNIRELQNLIERSVILTQGSVLKIAMPEMSSSGDAALRRRFGMAPAAERQRILRALDECGGVVGGPHGAAARLGLKRTTLQSRMKKLGIVRQYQ